MTGAPPAQDHHVERSPADVLRLVVAMAGLLVFLLLDALFGDTITSFAGRAARRARAPARGPARRPARLHAAGRRGVGGGRPGRGHLDAALPCPAHGAARRRHRAHLRPRGRHVLVRTHPWLPPDDLLGRLGDAQFPSATGLAVAAAVFTRRRALAVPPQSPDRLGLLMVSSACRRFVAARCPPTSSLALLWGWTAGAAAIVALGAPQRRPTADTPSWTGCAGIGVEVTTCEPAAVDARGSTPYFGATPDGTRSS